MMMARGTASIHIILLLSETFTLLLITSTPLTGHPCGRRQSVKPDCSKNRQIIAQISAGNDAKTHKQKENPASEGAGLFMTLSKSGSAEVLDAALHLFLLAVVEGPCVRSAKIAADTPDDRDL